MVTNWFSSKFERKLFPLSLIINYKKSQWLDFQIQHFNWHQKVLAKSPLHREVRKNVFSFSISNRFLTVNNHVFKKDITTGIDPFSNLLLCSSNGTALKTYHLMDHKEHLNIME